jgi:hypothetical protein
MAKSKVTKFRLLQGKVLHFTPTGKAVPNATRERG